MTPAELGMIKATPDFNAIEVIKGVALNFEVTGDR